MINPITRRHLTRIGVGVDPAVTSGENADDTGIIVAAKGRDGDAYVLEDATCHLTPDGWARKAVGAYDRWEADFMVAEVNNGGELVTTVIGTVRKGLPVKTVHASRGKRIRAEPIAALYEQGRVHHVGAFPDLEDQLCSWVPDEDDSPDRLDALVWVLTELMIGGLGIGSFGSEPGSSFFARKPQGSRWRV